MRHQWHQCDKENCFICLGDLKSCDVCGQAKADIVDCNVCPGPKKAINIPFGSNLNYIGSKYKLLPFIHEVISDTVPADLSTQSFCDIFAGTGVVSRLFKGLCYHVLANDFEYYSYVILKNAIGNEPEEAERGKYDIDQMNELSGIEGIIHDYYSPGGSDRLYFTAENAKKIDAARDFIRFEIIRDESHYFLLASLIESADKYANVASVYGAYLKHMKKSAQRDLVIKGSVPTEGNPSVVTCQDSASLIHTTSGDILYLDPPYNHRQYGANYHMLNTIAHHEDFIPQGVTGLRPRYKRSAYCQKPAAAGAFEALIKAAQFKYIFLSYNNEGIMSFEQIRQIMSQYGRYDLVTKNHSRFKADNNRKHKANGTLEQIHILEKSS